MEISPTFFSPFVPRRNVREVFFPLFRTEGKESVSPPKIMMFPQPQYHFFFWAGELISFFFPFSVRRGTSPVFFSFPSTKGHPEIRESFFFSEIDVTPPPLPFLLFSLLRTARLPLFFRRKSCDRFLHRFSGVSFSPLSPCPAEHRGSPFFFLWSPAQGRERRALLPSKDEAASFW